MILLKTDIFGVFYIILYVLFAIAIFATPSVLTFFLYRWLKKKGRGFKALGLIVFIGVTGFMSFNAYKFATGDILSDPVHETIEINQAVGGVLICSSTYYDDIGGWQYYIDYSYSFPNDSIRKIGTGIIYAEKWKKNEQIIKIDDWYVLNASHDRDADVLFIGNEHSKEWSEHVISPTFIESHELWTKERISTQLDNWDTVAKIEEISTDGIITVKYKYRKGNAVTNFQNGKRRITFKINMETGAPEMIKISEM